MTEAVESAAPKKAKRVPKKLYEAELFRLQGELVKLQEWVRAEGERLVVVFEGRDAAGKGGTIKRVTEYLNPRVARIAALPAPTERERTQWYFQRYVEHLPAAGEIVLFDRSWYNRGRRRAGDGLLHRRGVPALPAPVPDLRADAGRGRRSCCASTGSRSATRSRRRRFRSRLEDPMRRWKLSPMDLESITRWEDYSRAKDEMMVHTDIPEAPWYVVESDDKRRARINMIAHLLSTIPYHEVHAGRRSSCPTAPAVDRLRAPAARALQTYVPDHAATLTS